MRNNLFIIVIYFFFFCMNSQKTYAFFPKDDYLWIEFGEQIKERDGSLTQLLFVYYGKFPINKDNILRLRNLEGFYTQHKKDEKGEFIFYKANIETIKGKSCIRINSHRTGRFTVFVNAKRDLNETQHYYYTKTSFFLFGHSLFKNSQESSVLNTKVAESLNMSVDPEYSCWRQTGVPIRIGLFFNKIPVPGKKIYIEDENSLNKELITDKSGYLTYIPPDDRKLNLKGRISHKQTVIYTKKKVGNIIYVASYTLLLHPSRFGNRDISFGISILGATIIIVFISVMAKRRRLQL